MNWIHVCIMYILDVTYKVLRSKIVKISLAVDNSAMSTSTYTYYTAKSPIPGHVRLFCKVVRFDF